MTRDAGRPCDGETRSCRGDRCERRRSARGPRAQRHLLAGHRDRPGCPSGRARPPQGRPAEPSAPHPARPRREALDELFPGFSEEMTAAGVPHGDAQVDLRTYLDGHLLRPAPSGIIVFGVSRPLIEHMIRIRVAALEGIEIVDATDVLGLVTDMDRRRVTGVRVRRRTDDAEESTVDADLVVDASGRGSRARVWLRELGYPQPPTSNVRPDVVYVTRRYRREPQHLNGHNGSTMVPFPGLPRGGGVLREEGGRFAVVLFGLIGEEPPLDDGGMKAYAETLSGPDAAEIIRSARPLDEPVKMRYPASVRHHHEKLDRHLNGFLITGDALCNFNPTYGQGMTVAALEALLLRGLLADGTGDLAHRFSRRRPRSSTAPGSWRPAAICVSPRSKESARRSTGWSADTLTTTAPRPRSTPCSGRRSSGWPTCSTRPPGFCHPVTCSACSVRRERPSGRRPRERRPPVTSPRPEAPWSPSA